MSSLRVGSRPFRAVMARASLFLLGTGLVADAAGALLARPALWMFGYGMVPLGIVGGLAVAAATVAGLRGPDEARGPSLHRTAWSLLVGLAALALLALTRWVRADAAIPPDPGVLVLQALALALLLLAAWIDRHPTR